ncbi:MAG: hypothetical protein K5894_00720 [Lachnospiraceae bacterium]|nr:hypothetical protein [Lachnospiraceae bacterium]MDN4745276.1 hypothetical protein [Lachnospiraceae bacterium C1.1]
MIARLLIIIVAFVLILTARKSGALLERVYQKSDEWKAKNKNLEDEEDDDLTGKAKWRLIVAGYVIFILFAVFAAVSIFTLNQKINTLYGSVRSLEETVSELENSSNAN